jgi:hypothetical protein
MRLKIAGLIVEIFSDDVSCEFERCDDFRTSDDQIAALNIYLHPVNYIEKPQGDICLDDFNKWILHSTANHAATVYKCSNRDPENEPIYQVDVEDDWSNATISFLKNNKNVEEEVASLIGYILLKNRILFHQGLIIHAAAIAWKGKGIMFTAPSGTGKSTQADLWSTYRNATILNDDSPIVRLLNDQVIVFGTPWSGSKGIFQNAQAPLSAIIVLDQSDTNSFHQLTMEQSIPLLVPRCFLPYHDPVLVDIACTNLEKIIIKTPVYHLKCRPDKDAVEVVAQCLS